MEPGAPLALNKHLGKRIIKPAPGNHKRSYIHGATFNNTKLKYPDKFTLDLRGQFTVMKSVAKKNIDNTQIHDVWMSQKTLKRILGFKVEDLSTPEEVVSSV